MSIEAQDLVNRMIQLDPGNRLGHNLESIKILKTHPFFNGVDFTQISKRNYKGLLPIVEKLIPAHLGKLNDAEELKRQSLMNVLGLFHLFPNVESTIFQQKLCPLSL